MLTIQIGGGGYGGTTGSGGTGGVTSIIKSKGAGLFCQQGGVGGSAVSGCYAGGGGSFSAGGAGYPGNVGAGDSSGGGGGGTWCYHPGCCHATLHPGCPGTNSNGGNGGIGRIYSLPGLTIYTGGGGGGGGYLSGGAASSGYGAGCGGHYNGGTGNGASARVGSGSGGGGGAPGVCCGCSQTRGGKGGQGGSGAVYLYAAGSGGSSPDVYFSNYYRNGALVPCIPQNSKIPTSGQLQICEFYGAENTFAYTYYLPACSYAYNLCLPCAASSSGANIACTVTPVYANIVICGVLGSNINGQAALKIGPSSSWGIPPIVKITVGSKGVITGRGGSYINGVQSPTAAICFICGTNTIVTNNGIIQGGAGGSCQSYGFAAGAGYAYGLGHLGNSGHGNYNSTLFSGGAYQIVDTRGKKGGGYYTGGCGGGWVAAACQSSNTNGYGGSGQAPAAAFSSSNGKSPSSITFATKGDIRGVCGLGRI